MIVSVKHFDTDELLDAFFKRVCPFAIALNHPWIEAQRLLEILIECLCLKHGHLRRQLVFFLLVWGEDWQVISGPPFEFL